jgi:hypothetical protein
MRYRRLRTKYLPLIWAWFFARALAPVMAAVIQTATATSSSAISVGATLNVVTPMNAVVVTAFGTMASGSAPLSITVHDTDNSPYVVYSQVSGANWTCVAVTYQKNGNTTPTVTIELGALSSIQLGVAEVSGITRLDAGPVGTSGATGNIQPGSMQTSSNLSIVFAVGYQNNSTPAGFTSLISSGSAPIGMGAYKVEGYSQTENPNFGASSAAWVAMQVAFSSGPTPLTLMPQTVITTTPSFLAKKPLPGQPIRTCAKLLIKSGPGSLIDLTCTNLTGSARFIQFFDAATVAAVTLGVTQPDLEFNIPANQTILIPISDKSGIPFTNGIVMAITVSESSSYVGTAGDVVTYPVWT